MERRICFLCLSLFLSLSLLFSLLSPHQHPQARGRDRRKVPPHGAPGAAANSRPVYVVIVVVDAAAAAKKAEKAPAPAARRGAAEEPDRRREGSEGQGTREATADVGDRRHGAREKEARERRWRRRRRPGREEGDEKSEKRDTNENEPFFFFNPTRTCSRTAARSKAKKNKKRGNRKNSRDIFVSLPPHPSLSLSLGQEPQYTPAQQLRQGAGDGRVAGRAKESRGARKKKKRPAPRKKKSAGGGGKTIEEKRGCAFDRDIEGDG